MRITPDQREAWRASTANSPFNRWLNGQVRGSDGRLDLSKLYALALRFDVDASQYRHLNPGQQRMTVGNMLRKLVPEAEYAHSETPEAHYINRGPVEPQPSLSCPPFVREATVADLLCLHVQVMDELRERGIVRTSNAPGGDYAELLFSRAFGWTLANNSASGHDATDQAGIRYQIKSRRPTQANPSRQLSAIRRLPERLFDWLAAILFNPDYTVMKAALIPYDLIGPRSRYYNHTKAWTFMLEDGVWALSGVQDVTDKLTAASAGL